MTWERTGIHTAQCRGDKLRATEDSVVSTGLQVGMKQEGIITREAERLPGVSTNPVNNGGAFRSPKTALVGHERTGACARLWCCMRRLGHLVDRSRGVQERAA